MSIFVSVNHEIANSEVSLQWKLFIIHLSCVRKCDFKLKLITCSTRDEYNDEYSFFFFFTCKCSQAIEGTILGHLDEKEDVLQLKHQLIA